MSSSEVKRVIDLSLTNSELYNGCEIEEVAGRLNLTTPIDKAINIIGRNINNMEVDPESVTLTGPMAVWAYLIIFHSIVHRTRIVYYKTAINQDTPFLIAKHG